MARITAFGTLPGDALTDEQWSCGMHTDGVATAADALSFWSQVIEDAACHVPPAVRLVGVRTYADSADRASEILYANPVPNGGGDGARLPTFCSVAVTLQARLDNNRLGYNRFFLPNYGWPTPPQNTSLIDPQQALNMATVIANIINDPPTSVIPTVVWKGTQYPVESVAVDTVIDTQRRRKFSIKGSRQVRAIQ